jgi:hypothetical protein
VSKGKAVSKEDVIAAIKKLAGELGHIPNLKEVLKAKAVTRHALRMTFMTYREALIASGLERPGNYKLPMAEIFADWAAVARQLGKVPTMAEYDNQGKYSCGPLMRRYGGWRHVPTGLLKYAQEQKLEAEWKDVMELLTWFVQPAPGQTGAARRMSGRLARPRIVEDQPFYGAPLLPLPLGMAPTNEMGVMFLFGAVAREMGFMMMRLQAAFPDGEAYREVEPGRWQRVRIEFEFESRNFLAHLHPISGCELIVCWEHNWPECPMEVVELKNLLPELR